MVRRDKTEHEGAVSRFHLDYGNIMEGSEPKDKSGTITLELFSQAFVHVNPVAVLVLVLHS